MKDGRFINDPKPRSYYFIINKTKIIIVNRKDDSLMFQNRNNLIL